MTASLEEMQEALQRDLRLQRAAGSRVASRAAAPLHGRVSNGLASLPAVALGVDLLAMALTGVIAALGRNDLSIFPNPGGVVSPNVLVVAPATTLAGLLAIGALGGYDASIFGAGADEYRRVGNAWLITAAALGIGCYLTKFSLSRGFFVLTVVLGILLLVGGRYAMRLVIKRLRLRGSLRHRVLIVGSEAHVDEVGSVLSRESWLGYDVVGALTPTVRRTATRSGIPVLGRADEVVAHVEDWRADVVFVAGGAVDSAAALREIVWEMESSRARVVVAPSVTDVSAQRVSVRPVGGLPLIHLDKPRSKLAARRMKRSFDIGGSALLLVLCAPLIAVAAYQVRRFDGGPVLFRQTRIGRDGREFKVWKFRTMVTNAEELLAALHQQQGYDGGLFKMTEDPRVTRPGGWLRRYSVDELPQLVNVLKGDMSLVGPRPPLAHEVAQYDAAMARRLHVRPGMTGLWQVSGRSDLSWAEAVRLDLYYVDNWSMLQDVSILFRTLSAVVGSSGAY